MTIAVNFRVLLTHTGPHFGLLPHNDALHTNLSMLTEVRSCVNFYATILQVCKFQKLYATEICKLLTFTCHDNGQKSCRCQIGDKVLCNRFPCHCRNCHDNCRIVRYMQLVPGIWSPNFYKCCLFVLIQKMNSRKNKIFPEFFEFFGHNSWQH